MLRKDEEIDALVWAADKTGLSYEKFVVSLKPMVRFKIFGDYEALLEEKKRNNNPAIEVEPGEPNEDDDTEPELLEDMSDLPINDNLIHDIIETWEESDDEANQ